VDPYPYHGEPDADRTDDVAAQMDRLLAGLGEEMARRGGVHESLVPPSEPTGGAGRQPGEPGFTIDPGALQAIVPSVAETFRAPLEETCVQFEITTPLRLAHFLAQTAHESARYTALVENLNYGAPGLLATWPSRFDEKSAANYARQPERIANKVYADRMGNGPESSGDGWRFRGRGILQVTGRASYRAIGEALGVDLEAEPDQLQTPRLAALAAGWYWGARGINALCDRDDAVAVTEAVNGGRHGLQQRLELLNQVKTVLSGGDVVA